MKTFIIPLFAILMFSLQGFASAKEACQPQALTGSYNILIMNYNAKGEELKATVGTAELKPLTEDSGSKYTVDLNLVTVSELPKSLSWCLNRSTPVTDEMKLLEVSLYSDAYAGDSCDVTWSNSRNGNENGGYTVSKENDVISFYDCGGYQELFRFVPVN